MNSHSPSAGHPATSQVCQQPTLPSLAHPQGSSAPLALLFLSFWWATQPSCSEHQLQNQAACAQILAQTFHELQGPGLAVWPLSLGLLTWKTTHSSDLTVISVSETRWFTQST